MTAADLDGDGYADLSYSTGESGGPRVRAVSGAALFAPGGGAGTPALADFSAFASDDRGGVQVAARGVNSNGRAELVAAGGGRPDSRVPVLTLGEMRAPGPGGRRPGRRRLGRRHTGTGGRGVPSRTSLGDHR